MAHIILLVFTLLGSCLGLRPSVSSWLERGLVVLRLFCSWAKWPFRLDSLTGKCFVIRFVVRPGKDRRLFRRLARMRVEGRGLNRESARYLFKSCFVFWSLRTPFAWWMGRVDDWVAWGCVLMMESLWEVFVILGEGEGSAVKCPKDHLGCACPWWWLYCSLAFLIGI